MCYKTASNPKKAAGKMVPPPDEALFARRRPSVAEPAVRDRRDDHSAIDCTIQVLAVLCSSSSGCSSER